MPPTDCWNFTPAREARDWVQRTILAEDGAIHNPDHAHLIDADREFLWAPRCYQSKMRTVIGTAEEVAFRCSAWQRERQEQQMREWFGRVPKFLITLDASYCTRCEDIEFCALVEHELFHICQARDVFGAPAFLKSGLPRLTIQGHDVEEFVGVVRRYGTGRPDSAVSRMAATARGQPEVGRVEIAGACGTCLLRAA